ncbi:MAG TPA: transaldolase, partial [Chloroflexi bacterium]|nr:transaldolase [Chloroflexota bacterium]
MHKLYRPFVEASLGPYLSAIDATLERLDREKIVQRIWSHDHTVWKPEPAGIVDRLGWLNSPEMMMDNLHRLQGLADALRRDGYTHALLLGMGGSSLAPEVLAETFGVSKGGLQLAVVDSTDPGFVLAHAERLDPRHTLFIVSSKSGTTVETLSLFKYFYNLMASQMGADAGEHFVAITDPGSPLIDLAETYRFRAIFLNDPCIGGRYSALSFFG